MTGYIGYNSDVEQTTYEVGKTYKGQYEIYLNPLEIFKDYPPYMSKFYLAEFPTTPTEKGFNICCVNKIKILKELSVQDMLNAAEAITATKLATIASTSQPYTVAQSKQSHSIAAATTNCTSATALKIESIAVATGEFAVALANYKTSIAANTGAQSTTIANAEHSIAVTTGYDSSVSTYGTHSIAAVINELSFAHANAPESLAVSWGAGGASGVLGAWLLLAEYDKATKTIKQAKLFKVDGKTIKPNVEYTLVNGKPVEYTQPVE